MKGWDPEGQLGPRKPLPDSVQILEPPIDKIITEPSSEQREPIVSAPTAVPVGEAPEQGYQPQEPAYQADPYADSAPAEAFWFLLFLYIFFSSRSVMLL
jgi:small subunit ribosomal protein S3e